MALGMGVHSPVTNWDDRNYPDYFNWEEIRCRFAVVGVCNGGGREDGE